MVKKQFLIILTDPHFEEIIFFFFCIHVSFLTSGQHNFHFMLFLQHYSLQFSRLKWNSVFFLAPFICIVITHSAHYQ